MLAVSDSESISDKTMPCTANYSDFMFLESVLQIKLHYPVSDMPPRLAQEQSSVKKNSAELSCNSAVIQNLVVLVLKVCRLQVKRVKTV